MWGVTRAYEEMKKKQKAIISEEIVTWESLIRVADRELWGIKSNDDDMMNFVAKLKKSSNPRDNAWSLFVEWLRLDIAREMFCRGDDLEKSLQAKMPSKANTPGYNGTKYNFKHSSNGVTQDMIAMSNFLCKQDPESNNLECIQIVAWDNDELELEDTNPALTNVALVSNSNRHAVIDVGNCLTYKEIRNGTIPKSRLPKVLQEHCKFIPRTFYDVNPSDVNPSDKANIADLFSGSKRPHNTNTEARWKKRAVHTEDQDVQDDKGGNERHAKQIVSSMLEDPSLAKVFAEYLTAQARGDR
ncbi:hypothetical protein C0991_000887 [Blastosporella zonata]|nr:hypothetical protein C0991_000887 [Blastosporella zonata]